MKRIVKRQAVPEAWAHVLHEEGPGLIPGTVWHLSLARRGPQTNFQKGIDSWEWYDYKFLKWLIPIFLEVWASLVKLVYVELAQKIINSHYFDSQITYIPPSCSLLEIEELREKLISVSC